MNGESISQGIPTGVIEMETDILDYITRWHAQPMREDRHINPGMPIFSVLQRRYAKQAMGQYVFHLMGYKNVILWQHLSATLATAIVNLCVRGDIHWHEAFLVHYMHEGKLLPLPVAHWPITEEYDKPHWLPVCFEVGPLCDEPGCPKRSQ